MTEDTYRDKLNDLQLEVEELRAKLKEAQTGDLISREAALTALTSTAGVGNRALNKIRALPSAQPEERTETHACDLIDRQTAIERILATGYADQIKNNLLLILRLLPSAQPEIVRCKDCKWWDTDYGLHGFCGRHGYRFSTHREGYCYMAKRRKE